MQYVPVSIATEQVFFIQSASAEDMRDRIADRIAIQQGTLFQALSACHIGGAGDGHTFMTVLGFVSNATPVALTQVTIRPYLAADAQNLAIARAAAIVGLTGTKQDELFAGASKGHRFMGLVVVGSLIIP